MTTETAYQLAALKRIATFSAAVRGHELAEWHTGENFGHAVCARCGAELQIYLPVIQPEMDGSVLEQECIQPAAAGQAA